MSHHNLEVIFKGYDIRGKYPQEINSENVAHITYHMLKYIDSDSYILGYDTRISSPILTGSIIDVLTSQGKTIINFGIVPTEVIYWYSGYLKKPGIAVTASHNDARFNGIKLCLSGAMPVSLDDILGDIRDEILENKCTVETHNEIRYQDRAISISGKKNHISEYVEFLTSHFTQSTPKKVLKIGIDVSNGAACSIIDNIFQKKKGVEFTKINVEANGLFPNHDPNPLVKDNCKQLGDLIRKDDLDFGIIFDGDADRCCFLDSTGELIDPYLIYIVLLKDVPQKSKIIKSELISPLVKFRDDIEVYESKVGHSNIKKMLRKYNAYFGGEHSAHYYYSDFYQSDTGILTAIKVINAVVESGKRNPAECIDKKLIPFKSEEINCNVELQDFDDLEKNLLLKYPESKVSKLDGISITDKKKRYWFNIRKSNTETGCVRINAESFDKNQLDNIVDDIKNILYKK